MKFPLFLSAALLLFCRTEAQPVDTTTISEVFKSKRYWEIGLNHGFVRPTITPKSGPEKAYAINGRVFDLGLTYGFNASEKLSFAATGKLGAYPITLGIPETDYSHGIDSKQYFFWANYTPFAELSAIMSFRHFLSNKFALVSGGGIGAKFVAPTRVRAGFGSSGSYESRSHYVLENSGEAKPFLQVESALQYKLKNSDLLSLRLSYQHSFQAVQQGSYIIAENSPIHSYGDVTVKGHQLSLGLSYVFTGYEKLQRRMLAETSQNKKAFKKALKREYYEKRMAKSSAIRVYGAVFADQNTSTDNAGVIGSYRPVSLGGGLEFQRAFHPRFFWEAGLNLHEYSDGHSYHYPGVLFINSSSNAFEAKQLSAGAGYILRNKNLVPVFYFSGGAAMGYSPDYKGLSGNSGSKFVNPNSGLMLETYSDNYMLRKVFPLLYAGVRKDFRIRGKFFISPAFKYYQGLTKVYESRMQYTTNAIYPEVKNTTVFMRGSYFEYSLGLKLDL